MEVELHTVDPKEFFLPLEAFLSLGAALIIAKAASAAADVISLMFRKEDPDADVASATKKPSMTPPMLDPSVYDEDETLAFPNYMTHLITSALKWGTTSQEDVSEWTEALIPGDHISASAEAIVGD
jgi:hypothetical protein